MISDRDVEALVTQHVRTLALDIGSRPTGSEGNHRAECYLVRTLEDAGYEVERQSFECLDWRIHAVELRLDGTSLAASANPFSSACNVTAPFTIVDSLAELETSDFSDRIVVLHGELAAEPLFPKNFPFLRIERHQRILQRLEEGRPAAVVLVHPQTEYVAPLIEDGDFAIPSVTVAAPVGASLLSQPTSQLSLRIDADLRPSHGANVIARRRRHTNEKTVVCAHFDTKHGTPGALDNAAGVAALLALAQVLAAWNGAAELEFVTFNGEDYYSNPGQVAYLTEYGADFGTIALALNLDGVGLRNAKCTIAFFACPEAFVQDVTHMAARWSDVVVTEPWPQGDHTLFWSRGVPTIAFTSEGIEGLVDRVIHTPADTVDRVNPRNIASVVAFVAKLVQSLDSLRSADVSSMP